MTDITENTETIDQETGEIIEDTITKSEPVDYFARVQKGRQDSSQGRQWYAIHTYSGYEDAVKKSILTRMETFHMQDKIFDVVVPKESEVHMRQGKPVSRKKCIFPGYVLLDMIVTDDSWYLVRNTPNVTWFLWAWNIPVPVSWEELEKLKWKVEENAQNYSNEFLIWDLANITAWPFEGNEWKITEINEKKGLVKMEIDVMGRNTPVELDFAQVKVIR